MTGTSLDSIDVCFAKFEIGKKGEHLFSFFGGKEYKLPVKYSKMVLKIINKNTHISDISLFQVAYSNLIADAIKKCIKEFEIKDDIDAIAVHGQTLWHSPKKEELFNYNLSHTFQAMSGSTLTNLLSVPVIYDFRVADIAASGNGAPLLPIFDYNFLKDAQNDVICLNIGGISNITYIPHGVTDERITAFDTGVGNILIDMAMQKFFKKKYDSEGKIAKNGTLNKNLLNFLLDDDYYKISPPKSTGREKYSSEYFKNIIDFKEENKILNEDFITTLTYFTAKTIALGIKNFTRKNSKIIVSGGGRKNNELMYLLQQELQDYEIIKIDKIGINGDLKEALGFAYIGWRTIGGMYGNLPAATGALRKCRLGVIAI